MEKKRFIFFVLTSLFLTGVAWFSYAREPAMDFKNKAVPIFKGWNLVPYYYFFRTSQGDINRCSDGFQYAYFYSPTKKEYVGGKLKRGDLIPPPPGQAPGQGPYVSPPVYEFADNALNDKVSGFLGDKAFRESVMWVYSSAECILDTGKSFEPFSTSEKVFPAYELRNIEDIRFFQGWNFFSVPVYWKDGDKLQDYLGDCAVSRVITWDSSAQEWLKEFISRSASEVLEKLFISPPVRAASLPILFKVNQDCNLGYRPKESIPPPPSLPGEESNPSATSAKSVVSCTDSDGGQNYFVKGVTKGLNVYREGSTATDYCVFAGQTGYGAYLQTGQQAVMEYVCSSAGYKNDDLHVCEKGCQDGACIQ